MWRTVYIQRNCRWMGDEDSHMLCAGSCEDNYLPSAALNQRATQVQVMIVRSETTLLHISQHLGQTSSQGVQQKVVDLCVCVCVCVVYTQQIFGPK